MYGKLLVMKGEVVGGVFFGFVGGIGVFFINWKV